MRLRDQPRDIKQLEGDETSASVTGCIVRLARTAELLVRASLPNEGHASVRLDCREGIVCDLDRCERRRSEEGGLADVRFPDDSQLHHAENQVRPQVPLEQRGRLVTPGQTIPPVAQATSPGVVGGTKTGGRQSLSRRRAPRFLRTRQPGQASCCAATSYCRHQ